MEIQSLIAENLVRLRGELSRKDLAGLANVSYQHIYEIEEGIKNPSLKVLEKLAKALNVKTGDLFQDNGQTKPLQMPVSKMLQKLACVPDKVYEMACEIPPEDKETWEQVILILENAKERNEQKLASLQKS